MEELYNIKIGGWTFKRGQVSHMNSAFELNLFS